MNKTRLTHVNTGSFAFPDPRVRTQLPRHRDDDLAHWNFGSDRCFCVVSARLLSTGPLV